MARATILAQLDAERGRQDEQWGGPAHDAGLSRGQWIALIREHTDRAARSATDGDTYRQELVASAAVVVAALEAHDERSRHGR